MTRQAAAGLLLGAALAQAVLDDGGFSPSSRVIFATLSALALAAAVAADRRTAWRAARAPVVLVLWALGALGALSALWSVGFAGDSVRWGLVTFGYGAIAVSAAVLAARPRGVDAIVVAICALAAASAIFGLVGVASLSEPFADFSRAGWRPGGTLEYSAALSLLAVSALPGALTGMCARSRVLSAAATACGVICAAALSLGGSRAELAFAGFICLSAMLAPTRTVRSSRPLIVGAVGVLAAAGIGARLVAGGHVSAEAKAHTTRVLVELALVSVAAGMAWLAARRICARTARTGPSVPPTWVIAGLALALIVAALGTAGGGDLLHGRARTWRAAVATIEDRPLAGSGADSFLVASILHQRSSPVRFAHDLPLELFVELGVAGLVLVLALYASTARALWRGRGTRAAWLLGPAAAAFLAASLVDWPWHLAGSGAVWAAALGAFLKPPSGSS